MPCSHVRYAVTVRVSSRLRYATRHCAGTEGIVGEVARPCSTQSVGTASSVEAHTICNGHRSSVRPSYQNSGINR